MTFITSQKPHQEVYFIVDDTDTITGYEYEKWQAEETLSELIYGGYIIQGKIIEKEKNNG